MSGRQPLLRTHRLTVRDSSVGGTMASGALVLVLALILGALSCAPQSDALYAERERRIRAEQWIARAEAALGPCRQQASTMQQLERYRTQDAQRIHALEQELARIRGQLARACGQRTHIRQDDAQGDGQLGAGIGGSADTKGVVVLRETRFWKGALTAAWRTRLTSHRQGLEECYRKEVLPRQPGLSASSWVYLEIGPEGLANLIFPASSAPGMRLISACVGRFIRGRHDLKAPSPLLFAQYLIFAADPTQIPKGPVPAPTWPPPTVGPGFAKAGQVCRYNTYGRHGPYGVPQKVPYLSRPCAPGLKCCYPCGVQGCNSVCMKDCGPPRP